MKGKENETNLDAGEEQTNASGNGRERRRTGTVALKTDTRHLAEEEECQAPCEREKECQAP